MGEILPLSPELDRARDWYAALPLGLIAADHAFRKLLEPDGQIVYRGHVSCEPGKQYAHVAVPVPLGAPSLYGVECYVAEARMALERLLTT